MLAMLLAGIDEPTSAAVDVVGLARATVTAVVQGRPLPDLRKRPGSSLPPKPVFVTLEVRGEIRGCRGSLSVRTESLAAETRFAAIAAARHDPRYRPLMKDELGSLRVTVTVVERLEPLTSVAGLTAGEGLVLRSNGRVGVVLPWEGSQPLERLRWAFRKAGVPFGSPHRLERLVAERSRG